MGHVSPAQLSAGLIMKDGRLAQASHLDLAGVVNGGDHPNMRHADVFPSGKTSPSLSLLYFLMLIC